MMMDVHRSENPRRERKGKQSEDEADEDESRDETEEEGGPESVQLDQRAKERRRAHPIGIEVSEKKKAVVTYKVVVVRGETEKWETTWEGLSE